MSGVPAVGHSAPDTGAPVIRPESRYASGPAALTALTAIVVAVTAVLRARAGAGEPLWLDETWTGLHALQPTFGRLMDGIYIDVNAPLYTLAMWCWAGLAGVSDTALRIPSLGLALLVPFLALSPSGGTDRTTRLVWCALVAAWVPGLFQAQEARCYALLLGLCTLGTVLHARLIASPSLARAASWAGVGALAVLTHYHAVVLFGCQGLAYLVRHRGRAIATWPAAALYLPAFGWMGHHAPQLAAFAQSNWYTALAPTELPLVLLRFLGPGALLLLAASMGSRSAFAPVAERRAAVLPWVIGASAIGAVAVLAMGMFRPSFTPRYLTPFVPGLLLGLAAWAAAIGRARPWAPHAIVGLSLAWALLCVGSAEENRRPLNFEAAADDLMARGVDTVAFTWDNPSARGLTPSLMAELGSFFFRRASVPIAVTGLPLAAGADPNQILTAAARGDRPSLLWVYDLNVPGTAALTAPPAIESLDSSWSCRDFGRGTVGVVACVRPEAGPPRG